MHTLYFKGKPVIGRDWGDAIYKLNILKAYYG